MQIDLPKLDPSPYIYGSYGVALILIVGYLLWIIIDELRLKQIQTSANKGGE
ncbi:heme exporter protein CcmD [Oligoflexaceae bacterium]|nr:heme exporter protein CcmD [Oligoflexaceae bacterium]